MDEKPTLYLSLSGTDRADWQKSVAVLAGGILLSGILIGAGLMGLRETKARNRIDEPRRTRK